MHHEIIEIIVEQDYDKQRIDKIISDADCGISRNLAQQLCTDGKITANGKLCAKSYKANAGDVILIEYQPQEEPVLVAEDIPLDIVYEDDDLLVVNKPKEMVVHPAPGHYSGTLVNALLYHCGDTLSGINGVIRPGIVHRIDKDTTGLLVVAKNDLAHRGLSEQIKEHSFTREYLAIADGHFKEDKFTIDAPIGRNEKDRKKMTVTYKSSRNAVTHIEVIARVPSYSYIRCRLETGRTHQIRVHCAYYCHPIVGDTVYGYKTPTTRGTSGQCLHAYSIGFVHPRSGEYMEFKAPPPQGFIDILERLGVETL